MADARKRPPKLSSRTESFKESGEPSSDAKRMKHGTQSSSEEDGEIKMKLQIDDKQPSSSQRHKIQRQHHHHSDDERRRDGSSSRNREGARLHSRVGGVSRSQKPDRSPRHRREKHGSERTIDRSSRQYRSRDDVKKTSAYRVHRKDRDVNQRGRDSSKERSQDRRGLDESEDLRRVLDRKRREERQSVSDVSSEEEEEGKEVLERVSVSSDGEISDERVESPNLKEETLGKSDVDEPSSQATKESRWLSRDSGSDNEEEGSEEQATTVTKKDTISLHRQIGGYGVKDEEMSGSDSEEVSAQLEEDLKELEGEEVEEQTPEDPVLPDYYPGIYGCRSVENYEWLNRIEEGTFGVVFRGKEKRTNEIVALKKLKMEKEKEGFPITSLREVCCLLKAKHPNIVHVREIVVGSNMDKIYIVMDFIEHDLKALMETMKQPFLVGEVKTLMLQLLRGVHHLHDNWILHRDLKTSNLLLSHKGILKIGDFGLARDYGSPLKPYTPIVVTLWYRSPELLLGEKLYSTAVDMWSVGCIFGELLLHKPLFQGKSEIDQLNKIFQEMGTPNEKIWPKYPELPHVKDYSFKEQPFLNLRKKLPITVLTNSGFDLINRLLTYDPEKRISAESALLHEYFKESPLPVDPSMFPTWPAKSENVRKSTRERSPSAPIGGAAFQSLNDDEDSSSFSLNTAQKGQAASGPGFTLKF